MKIVKALFNLMMILLWVPALVLCHGTMIILAGGILIIWLPISCSIMDTLWPYLRACGWCEGCAGAVSFVCAVSASIIGTVIYMVVVSIPLAVLSPIDKKLLEPFEKPF